MDVSIKQVRAFLAVAQSRSFAEASERLHLSQPALSITIRKLEETVGGALFARSTRQLALTPEGRHFYPVARRLMNDWGEAFDDLDELFNKRRGKVTIATLPTLAGGMLPEVIAQFRECYPRINLSIHDVLAEQVNEFVRQGRADIGFSVAPPQSEDIDFEVMFRDRFVVICPSGHELLAHSSVSWSKLAHYPFIGISRLSGTRQDIERTLGELGVTVDIVCEINGIATVGRMVASGIGVSVLPSLSLRQIATEGIEWRPMGKPQLVRCLGLITRSRHPLSVSAQEMIQFVRNSPLANQ